MHEKPSSPNRRTPSRLVAALRWGSFRIRSLIIGVQVDGLGGTLRRVWSRFFGTTHTYVFVRHLKPSPAFTQLPLEANGIVVRYLAERDLADLHVRRYVPSDAYRLAQAMVATRQGRIVGAVWYTNSVAVEQPWYVAVEPHLVQPALLTSNIFVVPGDKAVAWALAKSATDQLAATGVHTVVGLVESHNTPSILMSRLLGARMVARMSVRYWCGCAKVVVEPVTVDKDPAITTPNEAQRQTPTRSASAGRVEVT